MSPIGSAHAAVVNRLTQLLVPRRDDYAAALPGPDDALLLIEVVDTSADSDRAVKVPLYARSGIGEIWLIDLAERLVEVYTEPASTGYRAKQTLEPSSHLAPGALPGLRLAVADCFPD
jgi:Uma2 family endonuclease